MIQRERSVNSKSLSNHFRNWQQVHKIGTKFSNAKSFFFNKKNFLTCHDTMHSIANIRGPNFDSFADINLKTILRRSNLKTAESVQWLRNKRMLNLSAEPNSDRLIVPSKFVTSSVLCLDKEKRSNLCEQSTKSAPHVSWCLWLEKKPKVGASTGRRRRHVTSSTPYPASAPQNAPLFGKRA